MHRTWISGTGRAARIGLTAAAMIAVAFGGAPSAEARPDDWWFGNSGTMIRGAAASQTSSGNFGLGVYARSNGGPEDAWGQFRYGEDAEGGRGEAGEVHCLTRDAAGLIQVSGRIFASGGENDVGEDFAATIDTESSPQRFSGVRLGPPGTIAPCSGGTAEFHPVTRGRYESSPAERK